MNIYNYKNQTSDFYLFSHLNDKNFFNNDQAINKKSFYVDTQDIKKIG